MFDWYWYARGTGKGGGAEGFAFLDGALEDGFLKAPNRGRLKFCLMWATQDWVDVHPAKPRWSSSSRGSDQPPNFDPASPARTISQPLGFDGAVQKRPSALNIFDGFLLGDASIWRAGLDYISQRYLGLDNYYRVPTKLPNGTLAQCGLLSIYQPSYLTVAIGAPAAATLVAAWKAEAAANGTCVHLSFMRAASTGSAALDALVDSYSDYGWMKTAGGLADVDDVPYADVVASGVKAWGTDTAAAAKLGGKPYIPPISSAWDPSPRTLPTDPWVRTNGYPWGSTWHSTPAQFEGALAQGRKFLEARCGAGNLPLQWCPPMLINAWNEWSEGAYLEPDERYGFGKLEAVRAVFGGPAPAPAPAPIALGAVRWDAWYGSPGQPSWEQKWTKIVGQTVTSDMADPKWHYRLPFFANVTGNGTADVAVTADGNSTAVMEAEIKYAADFGFSFWAFCQYPIGCMDYDPAEADCPKIQCCAANYQLSYALERYFEASNAHLMNFTLVLQGSNWFPTSDHGGNETIAQEAARYVSYFQKTSYHKVLEGRPLLFVLGTGSANFKPALAELEKQTTAALGVRPYVVLMKPNQWPQAQALGMDAVSAYSVQTNGAKAAGAPFNSSIAAPEAASWANAADQGGKIIPSITPGWDPSPREYIDLPWGDQGHTACVEALGHACYVQDPTMAELTAHTRDAVAFALEHQAGATEANAVIVGAWNENDEGHWVVPSLLGGTQKLVAVQEGVRQAHAALACGVVAENWPAESNTVVLRCAPGATIASVDDAEFGTLAGGCSAATPFHPSGACTAYSSSAVIAVVSKRCLHKSACAVPVDVKLFGPTDKCSGIVKSLGVRVTCA